MHNIYSPIYNIYIKNHLPESWSLQQSFLIWKSLFWLESRVISSSISGQRCLFPAACEPVWAPTELLTGQSGHSSGKSDQPSPAVPLAASCYCPSLFSPAPNPSLENQITFAAPWPPVALWGKWRITPLKEGERERERAKETGSECRERDWGGRRWEIIKFQLAPWEESKSDLLFKPIE